MGERLRCRDSRGLSHCQGALDVKPLTLLGWNNGEMPRPVRVLLNLYIKWYRWSSSSLQHPLFIAALEFLHYQNEGDYADAATIKLYSSGQLRFIRRRMVDGMRSGVR